MRVLKVYPRRDEGKAGEGRLFTYARVGTRMIHFLSVFFLLFCFFLCISLLTMNTIISKSAIKRVSGYKLAQYSSCVLLTEITVLGSKEVKKNDSRSLLPPLVKGKSIIYFMALERSFGSDHIEYVL